jgi:hypothetical protein
VLVNKAEAPRMLTAGEVIFGDAGGKGHERFLAWAERYTCASRAHAHRWAFQLQLDALELLAPARSLIRPSASRSGLMLLAVRRTQNFLKDADKDQRRPCASSKRGRSSSSSFEAVELAV